MPIITYREAVGQAIDEEMARDERVLLMGEEVAQYNGAYKVSRGLWDKYGSQRVIDTPITEEGFTGIGIGAAMAGLRPIVEWMTFNFAFQAFDQVINNAAKMLHMSGGQINVPIVFRGPHGPAEWLSSQHSQSCAAFYAHIPGIKVVCASNPADAKGLLKSAIRDDNPVVMMEGELMYGWKGDVPEGEHLVPIGEADVKREGSEITVIGYGRPMKVCLEAAEEMEKQGVDTEVIDLRSIRPMDFETLVASVEKTNRCVVVDEGWPVASVGAYVASVLGRRCFDLLDAPIEVVNSEDVPMPYNHKLELAVQPSTDKVIEAMKTALYMD